MLVRRSIAVLAVAAGLIPLPAGAVGDPCGSDGLPALGVIQVGTGDDPTVYIDERNFVFGNGVWVYLESNGVQGLQRGAPDKCVESENPDTVIL